MPVVGLGLVGAVLSTIDLSEVISTLGQTDVPLLLLSFLMMAVFYFLRAVRWSAILRWKVSSIALFRYSSIGYLVSSILPLQAGELVKPGLLRARHGIDYAEGLASVGVERLLDILTFVMLVMVSTSVGSLSKDFDGWVTVGLRTTAIIAFVSLLTIIIAVVYGEKVVAACRLATMYLRLPESVNNAILGVLGSLLRGAGVIGEPRTLAIVLGLSAVLWLSNFFAVFLVFWALGLHLTPFVVLLGFAMVSLGLMVPLTPGYIGQYESLWMVIFPMIVVGSRDMIASTGLLSHAVIIITIATLGAASLTSIKGSGSFRYFSSNTHTGSLSETMQGFQIKN
jgi:uncharacterized protein (TIRG00374 family)